MKNLKIKVLFSIIALVSLTGCNNTQKNDASNYAFIVGDNYLGHVKKNNLVYVYKKDKTATVLCSQNQTIKSALIKSEIEIKGEKYPVTEIFDNAFKNCNKLKEINIPENIKTINDNAFLNCVSLNKINLPNSLTHIGKCAFKNTGIEEINLSNNVSTIENYAFSECHNLSKINISEENQFYKSKDGILYTKSNELKQYPSGKQDKEYSIDESTISILEGAFAYNNYIEKISLNNITFIDKYAFYQCDSLEKIMFGNSLSEINDEVFANCNSLHYITIPDSVTKIGNYAFYNCKELFCLRLSSSLQYVGKEIVLNSDSSVILEENGINTENWDNKWNNSYRPTYTFKQDNLCILNDIVYILNNETASAIAHIAPIKTLNIPSSITYNNAEYKIKSIGKSAFEADSNIEELTVGDNLYNIKDYAFSECSNLKTIRIGESNARIENYSFNKCSSLKSINFGNNIQMISSGAFNDVPLSCFNTYDNAYYIGNEQSKYLYLIRTVTKNINSCKIHDDTLLIADASFQNCSNLKTLNFPKKLSYIGNYALYNCKKMTSVSYAGTKEEWKNISKGLSWKGNDLESIFCQDGELTAV